MIGEQTRRLLVPFLFWTLFYAFWSLSKAQAYGYADSLIADLRQPITWLNYLLLGDVKCHMHFLPTLFGLVLFYPLFRLAISHPWLGLVIFFCLLVKRELDVFLWANAQEWPGFFYLIRGVKIFAYCGYGMMAGAFLGLFRQTRSPEQNSQWARLVLYGGMLLFLIKLVYTAGVVRTGTWLYNFTPAYWADFLMPGLLFAGCMLMAHRRWPTWLSRAAPYSFGIYLCHPIFLDLAEIISLHMNVSPTQFVIGKIFFALGLTSLFVMILARIHALAWTIGLGPLPSYFFFSRRRPTELINKGKSRV